MIDILERDSARLRIAVKSLLSLAFAVVIGLLALVQIPIPGTPVPMTLQTFALLSGAGLLGRGYALQMAGWYVLLGLAGAPFFAGGTAGWVQMAGPSGGYLIGFVLAAGLVGFLTPCECPAWRRVLIFLVATLVIYVPGLFQLKLVTGADWPQTFAMGLAPFIVGDVVKAVAAGGGVALTRRWL